MDKISRKLAKILEEKSGLIESLVIAKNGGTQNALKLK